MEYKLKLDCKLKTHTFQGVKNILPIILQNMKKDMGAPIYVYYDTDIDGVLAGEFGRRFVEYFMKCRAKVLINSNRAHGFKKDLREYANKNIIGVDFSVDDEKMREITAAGCNCIILDHHDCGESVVLYFKGHKIDYNKIADDEARCRELLGQRGLGIMINNQYLSHEVKGKVVGGEADSSRYLSGAGVVFEVIKEFLSKHIPGLLPFWDTKEQRAMVGWSLLSDMRDIENENAKAYLNDLFTYNPEIDKGITHPGHDLMASLLRTLRSVNENNQRSWNRPIGRLMLDRKNMDFSLSPLMNANFRFDRGLDVIEYMMGNLDKLDLSMHQRQKELVKKLDTIADKRYYGDKNCLCAFSIDLNHPDIVAFKDQVPNFVGLLCNKYKVNCSVIGYSMDNGEMMRASFRGRKQGIRYKDELMKMKLLEGAGHQGAFGILKLNPTDEVFNKIAEICRDLEDGEDTYDFDIIEVDNLRFFSDKTNPKYRAKDGNSLGYHIAFENMYHLDERKTRLRYTSRRFNSFSGEWNAAKTACTYTVDGVDVLAFNYPLTPKSALILPILEDGVIRYYLDMSDPELLKPKANNMGMGSMSRKQIIKHDIDDIEDMEYEDSEYDGELYDFF